MTAQSVSSRQFASGLAGSHAMYRATAGAWIDWFMVGTALLVCFATPLLLMRIATQWTSATQSLIALGIALACAAAAVRLSSRIEPACAALASLSGRTPLWVPVIAGLALRLAWVVAFPAQPASDGATYFSLATRLAAGEAYATAGTLAYWPPGYPFFLLPWIALLGAGKAAVLASNLALYLVAVLGIARLGYLIAGQRAGFLAALLFALWPNYVTNTTTPEKEMLLVAVLPWVFVLFVASIQARSGAWRPGAAGALLGACVLVQPSLQLLPLAAACALLGLAVDRRAAARGSLALLLAAAAVVLPWTLRNYAIFERFVLVSTNGGGTLYRANNPLATGGYTDRGADDLSHLGELEQDLRGRELGVQWIKNHPAEFLRLAVEKQIRFTGDDAVGVYSTLNIGRGGASTALYAAFKLAANAFWMALWIAVAALCLHLRARRIEAAALLRLPLWIWLYLFAIHSVFESAGKYHVVAAWALSVLVAGHVLAAAQTKTAQ